MTNHLRAKAVVKFLFVVQGEGRGHMTQAIALNRLLEKNGHIVCHVIVGKSKRRMLPPFFREQITAPVSQLESPNFITDKDNKSVKIFRTILMNVLKVGTFLKNVNRMDQIVKEKKPDVILNFYDFLAGLYFMIKKTSCRHVILGHQFFFEHSDFIFPKGRRLDKVSLRLVNYWVGYGSTKKLALSFRPLPDEKEKRLFIVPPLLREEVLQKPIKDQGYLLIYIVNEGYSGEVEDFHRANPEIPIHCFWDKKNVPDPYRVSRRLTFHRLNDKKFIDLMAGCLGYLTTAGFESVCEAMYMGKPVLMVPMKGHYEQACNATDAQKAGAGLISDVFDPGRLLNYLPSYEGIKDHFRQWCKQTEILFIQNLTSYDH